MGDRLFELSGKVALVSGGSRGIGASIASTLAQYGAHVLVCSRTAEACASVVEEIRANGGKADAHACHIGEHAQIEALYEAIARQYGALDILVNNAATNPYYGPIADTDVAAFQKTVDVNIKGYFFMSALAVKQMKLRGRGSIINVASVNGVIPGLNRGIYSITKAAVISMTQAFAKEYASIGIRVNALLPGATDTRLASALLRDEQSLARAMQHVPMNRVAQPSEMAGAVLYLASDAASYTTGACLNVDGGYLLA